jgi:hypothetical protein
MAMTDDEKRVELIKQVQKLGRLWEPLAMNEAAQAVRRGGSKEIEQARRTVEKHDTRSEMADEVIKLINAYWPIAEAQA